MMVMISTLKPAKIAGRKGDLELEAISVRTVDGVELYLDGGYDKLGKGRKALSTTLFLLVAWPLIFLKGKKAQLPSGTVFDARTEADTIIKTSSTQRRVINLSRKSEATVEVLCDDMEEADDAEEATLPMLIVSCDEEVATPRITIVNADVIDTIDLEVQSASANASGCFEMIMSVPLKKLAETFKKGINTFQVEFGSRQIEVILEVEL